MHRLLTPAVLVCLALVACGPQPDVDELDPQLASTQNPLNPPINSYSWGWGHVTNVRLGGGDNVLAVPAGSTFSLSSNYFFDLSQSSCPGCIAQIVFGVGSSKKCVVSGMHQKSGNANITLTAPTAPGSYMVWATYQLEYGCASAEAVSTTGGSVALLEVYADPFNWSWGSVSNVTLNGKTAKRVRVASGSTVALAENYSITIEQSTCPNCITQIVMGIENGSKQCVYNGMRNKSGSTSASLTAPSTPGLYKVWAAPQLEYNCTDAVNRSNGGTAVSYVEVDMCSHDKCSVGGPLNSGCDHMCVSDICTADWFCCNVYWGSSCVAKVASICKQSC